MRQRLGGRWRCVFPETGSQVGGVIGAKEEKKQPRGFLVGEGRTVAAEQEALPRPPVALCLPSDARVLLCSGAGPPLPRSPPAAVAAAGLLKLSRATPSPALPDSRERKTGALRLSAPGGRQSERAARRSCAFTARGASFPRKGVCVAAAAAAGFFLASLERKVRQSREDALKESRV
ncbi:hypothetical protein E2320_013465 [Naja naja]|nr:hypothetical protein E2320_013465 [Naja naja]